VLDENIEGDLLYLLDRIFLMGDPKLYLMKRLTTMIRANTAKAPKLPITQE
jgi:hypothetical protein